jgi:uncharacterized protein YbjT (DUF2867 family)
MHIAIIGATGLIGSQLVQKFQSDPNVSKLSLVVRSQKEYANSKIEQIVLNPFDVEQIEALTLKADIYICALGTTIKVAGSKDNFKKVDLDFVVAFGKLAQKQEAKAFYVVSALGANAESNLFYNQVKGQMEDAILKLDIESINILRPSLLIGERKEFRMAEKVGIFLYRNIGSRFPKGISSKLGTEVSDIVKYLSGAISSTVPGKHIIEQF